MSFVKWIFTVVVCLAVAGGLSYYKYSEIRAGMALAAAYPEQSETIEVAEVTSVDYFPQLTVIGEVVAPRRLDLRNEIAGEIASVNFMSGSGVVEGQVLIQLDTTVEAANLRAAQARAELARAVFDRNKELFDSGVSNADQVDRAQADLTTSLAAIDVLERTIEQMTLRAPFDGRAGLHTFEVGQYLPDNTLITSLVGNTDYMWVDFQLPQFYQQLSAGTKLDVSTIDNDANAQAIKATVIAENTILNSNSRSRSYRARIPADASRYAANTMLNVRVPTGARERVLRVPAVAIQNDPLGQYVYVIYEDGQALRVRQERVVVKAVTSGYALLENNTRLVEGDRIAAAGSFKLYENMLVRVGERAQTEATISSFETSSVGSSL